MNADKAPREVRAVVMHPEDVSKDVSTGFSLPHLGAPESGQTVKMSFPKAE